MFTHAYPIAAGFTSPVIISRKTIAGDCSSTIGAFVIINADGWFVTASHILEYADKLTKECAAAKKIAVDKAAIEANPSLTIKEKRRAIGKLQYPPTSSSEECSIWWGKQSPANMVFAAAYPPADIAVGRLEPFNPKGVLSFPTFKDPSKPCPFGTSLLKVGYPFHSIQPAWDASKRQFSLPEGSLPIPTFPIEGIFTRDAEGILGDGSVPPIPVRLLETSTPGLRGQSGGPIVDTKGTIWAIQSKTASLPLGFMPEVPGNPGHREHQFLNVGLGVHPETIIAFFHKQGIQFQMSDY